MRRTKDPHRRWQPGLNKAVVYTMSATLQSRQSQKSEKKWDNKAPCRRRGAWISSNESVADEIASGRFATDGPELHLFKGGPVPIVPVRRPIQAAFGEET